jgi:hypothetical protein
MNKKKEQDTKKPLKTVTQHTIREKASKCNGGGYIDLSTMHVQA